MAKIDQAAARVARGSDYPAPYDVPCRDRVRRALGDVAGLTQFGVNLLELSPGAWSSQRHWHSAEDEFVWILEGEVVLVTEGREEILRAGDCAGFKAGDPDGHHLQNRSARPALILEMGSRRTEEDVADYPDIDLRYSTAEGDRHRDGTPY
ncbi:cupin domain-containing protein [Microvirga pudoricolor]|uniref:cupin domain-containing protein n=1 Tax=Microvirga pudoricolor TaxID=2778729 RepID=UPI0019506DBC|nr:cupin domain-containing protein [Microvirga pudoricolor]MBM6595614.1 cupin domain-containing protein [Microvirga pudoricolor]